MLAFGWRMTPTRELEMLEDPDPERARRAMESMVKINIAEVERAASGV